MRVSDQRAHLVSYGPESDHIFLNIGLRLTRGHIFGQKETLEIIFKHIGKNFKANLILTGHFHLSESDAKVLGQKCVGFVNKQLNFVKIPFGPIHEKIPADVLCLV